MRTKLFNAIKVSALALLLSFGLSFVYAWTAPTANPPAGNVSAPINTSGTAQTKAGNLTISATTTSSYFADLLNPTFFVQPSGNSVLWNTTIAGTTTTNGLKVVNGAGANKVLTSDASGNATWGDSTGLPAGGTTGQVITKQADGSATWQAPTGGMVILLTDAQKIAYYAGHGVTLSAGSHACVYNLVANYGCTYKWDFSGVEKLEARADGYIYLTHVPTYYSGGYGYWLLSTTGYADYIVWNYLTNTKAGSGTWVAATFFPAAPAHTDYYVNGCTTCSMTVAYAGGDFNANITGVLVSGINTSSGVLGWDY